MNTFDDIIWKKHSIPGAIQGILNLPEGFELSVAASSFHYCSPREDLKSPDLFITFEVVVFNPEGDMVDEPMGWQSREDINSLLSNY